MKVVLMAGGKGTRISSIASDIPKPMIPIEGKPVLEWEIECLRKQGFTDLLITVSYLGQIIIDYFSSFFISKLSKFLTFFSHNKYTSFRRCIISYTKSFYFMSTLWGAFQNAVF